MWSMSRWLKKESRTCAECGLTWEAEEFSLYRPELCWVCDPTPSILQKCTRQLPSNLWRASR